MLALLLAGYLFWHTPGYNPLKQGSPFLRYGLAAGIGLCCGWLLSRLFESCTLAATTLSSRKQGRCDLQIDSALVASDYSPAYLLVAFLWPITRGLIVPVALSALLSTAASCCFTALADPYESDGVLQILLSPVSIFGIFLSGMFGVTALLLLWTRAKVESHPVSNALAIVYSVAAFGFGVISQVACIPYRHVYGTSNAPQVDQQLGRVEPLPYLIYLLLLVLTVLGPLQFKGWRGAGAFVAWSLPPLFIANCFLLFYLGRVLVGSNGFDPSHLILDTFFAWSMFAPVSAIAVPHPACLGTGFAHMIEQPAWHQWRWPFLIAAQLVLVCGLLRCALDSIALAREAGHE
jgi:hypothetical protein